MTITIGLLTLFALLFIGAALVDWVMERPSRGLDGNPWWDRAQRLRVRLGQDD